MNGTARTREGIFDPVKRRAATRGGPRFRPMFTGCSAWLGGRPSRGAENFFREFLASVAEKCFISNPALQEASSARPKKSRKKVSKTLDIEPRSSYLCSPFKKWLSQKRGMFFEKRWCICQLF
jgi:hypothetical protein